MDEARSLQYSIDVRANVEKAEQDIQNLISQCGRLRAEAAGTVGISADADVEQAAENIRELTGEIGALQSDANADIIVSADTGQAEANVRDLTECIGNIEADSVEIHADTEQAQTDVQELADTITNLGRDPPDIEIDADTSEAERNIRELTDDIGEVTGRADSIGSAFRRSFLASENSGNALALSLRSGVGGALTYAGHQAVEFRDNVVTRMQEAANRIVGSARDIGQGFAHPITTIRTGLGGAIDHARNRFIDFVRGADEAAESADHVGDSSSGSEPEVEGLGDTAERSGGKLEKLGGIMRGIGKAAAVGLTAATVAVGGFAASSINAGMTFDSSMSQVAATMGYTVEELNDSTSAASQNFSQLREFAMEMGANTAFSASQAADALNYMALAGYDAETSMTMLPNVLNLAAAGGIELASASDMVTDAQSALGLTLDETSELVDKMAAASSKSNTSVQQLGDAILTVGGTAKGLAGGTTELSMALGVLADNGVKGAEGGTALRNMILSLSAPTDKAAAQLKSLNVEAFDAEGNLRPLNETFGDLNNALTALTPEKQTQALSEIFNRVDLRSVNAMLGTSSERWYELGVAIDGAWVSMGSLSDSLSDVGLDLTDMQSNLSKLGVSESDFSDLLKISGGNAELFTEALLEAADAGVSQADVIAALGGNLEDLQTAFDNTSGAAANMADTQLDNLAGDITLFKSALEGAQIVISDELSPSLREFTQFGTEAVTALSEAFQEGGLAGAMDVLGSVLSDGLSMVIGKLPTAVDAGMQLLGALGRGLLDNMPMMMDAAVQIVTILGDGILSSLPVVVGAAMQVIASLASGIGGMLPSLIPSVVETVMLIAGTLIENLPLVLDAGMQLISGLADGIIGAVPVLIGQLPELIEQIVGFLSESLPEIFEQGASILLSITEGLIGAIPLLSEQLPQMILSIVGFVTENLPTILEQGVLILTNLTAGIIGALPELIGQLPTVISSIVGTLSENFPAIVSTGVTLLLDFAAGIISAIPQLVAQLPAIGAAILGALSEIPGLVISVGKNIVEGLWSGISSMAGWVADKVKGFAGGIVDNIKGFLGIHSPSTVFAEIGDNMALGLGGGFDRSMKGVAEDMKGAIPMSLDGPEVSIPDVDNAMGELLKSSGVDWQKYSNEAWAASDNMFAGLIEDLKYNLGELGTSTDELQDYLQSEYNLASEDALSVANSFEMVSGLIEDLKYNLGELGTSADELQEYLQFEYDLDTEDAFEAVKALQNGLGGFAPPPSEDIELPETTDYSVNPIMGDLNIPQVADVSYGVHPVVEGIKPPQIPGMTFEVSPLVDDFSPPGYEESMGTDDSDDGDPERAGGGGDDDGNPKLVESSNSAGGGGPISFAPVINVEIIVRGNADRDTLENVRSEFMPEFEARVRALFDEFREEELQRMSLKNQYAF